MRASLVLLGNTSDEVVVDPDSRVLKDLEEKIRHNSARIDEVTRALYGHEQMGQPGFRKEVLEEVAYMREEVRQTKQLCDDLRQERRDELAERQGSSGLSAIPA